MAVSEQMSIGFSGPFSAVFYCHYEETLELNAIKPQCRTVKNKSYFDCFYSALRDNRNFLPVKNKYRDIFVI